MFTKALGHLQRLYGTRIPGFDYLASVLNDIFSATNLEHVGSVTIEAEVDKIGVEVQPPNRPGQDWGLPTTLKVKNEATMFLPTDQGPSGGYSQHVIGSMNLTPNRTGDVTVDSRFGTGIFYRIIIDGEEVVVIPPPPEGGDCTLKSLNGEMYWDCVEDVTVSCCVDPIPETLTFSWTHINDGGGSVASPGELMLVWDGVESWLWSGEPGAAADCVAGQEASLQLRCEGVDSNGFTLRVIDALGGATNYSSFSATCSPFFVDLSGETIGFCGSTNIEGVTISE